MTYIISDPKYVVREKEELSTDNSVDDLLDDVFDLQKKTLRRKTKLLNEQLEKRKEILDTNRRRIDYDLCACTTASYQIPDGDVDSQHELFLRHKLPLYQEVRREETAFFKDTAQLERELLDAKIQYYSLFDKEELLK